MAMVENVLPAEHSNDSSTDTWVLSVVLRMSVLTCRHDLEKQLLRYVASISRFLSCNY